MNRPPCKRCLLAETDADGLYETVRRRIAQMPDADKVPDTVYRMRLECCTQCDMLSDGICTMCGCFAELRAAKVIMHCPHEHPRW